MRGKDSAGALIELYKQETGFTAAKVIDVILGTAEAEIISTTSDQIEFTIRFPAGVSITYVGTIQYDDASFDKIITGTWTQIATGIFGEDTGTWSALGVTLRG